MTTQTKANINLDVVKQFVYLKKNNRLAHAYLFIGPSLIGKSETALVLSKVLNDELSVEGAAGIDDEAVTKIKTAHPDIHYIECEYGETIKIDNVRHILDQVKFRPFQSAHKIFIVRNIEALTLEAANALLKTLEEPSATSLLILTTSLAEKVLPTIRSRCQPVFFRTNSNDEIIKGLKAQFAVSVEESQYLAYSAEGCWGKAKQFKEADFFKVKNDYIDRFILAGSVDSFIKEVTAEKIQTKMLLDVLLGWMRDALVIKIGVGKDDCIHRDRFAEIVKFSGRREVRDLLNINAQIVEAKQMLNENLNVKISLAIIKELING